MRRTIIADTSCLIILSNIGELTLLRRVYGSIITTKEVADEYGLALPAWIEVDSPIDKERQKDLEIQLDKGEASAIALAIEVADSVVILDDNKARRIAEALGIEFTGTIGVIVKAKLRGIIPSVKPFLAKIKKTDFRLSDEIYQEALKESGE